ncbi:MAG: hypothetical protein NDI62_02320 [Burkholderiales bacterium]|nr:hypothetical protein [Burkholderiales bacterium]
MSKKLKYVSIGIVALFLVLGIGASFANAALTLEALTVSSSGALNLNGEASSNINLGSTTTTGNIIIGGGLMTGKVGIGTTSPTAKLHVISSSSPTIFFEADTLNQVKIQAHNDTSWMGNFIHIGRSRGTSASPTAVVSGDTIMAWVAQAHDGTQYKDAAEINFKVDGTVSTNITPTKITFDTTNTTGTKATKMIITNSGNVGIGTTAPAAKLDVNGTMIFRGNATVGGTNNLVAFEFPETRSDPLGYSSMKIYRNNIGQLIIGDTIDYNSYVRIDPEGGMRLTTPGQTILVGNSSYNEDFGNYSLGVQGQVGSGGGFYSSGIAIRPKGSFSSNESGLYNDNEQIIAAYNESTSNYLYANNKVLINNNGNVGIGTTSPNANAIVDLTSTTKAFMPPRMTTAQRDAIPSPTAGMVIYNTTANKLNVYTTTWETITSAP